MDLVERKEKEIFQILRKKKPTAFASRGLI